MHKEKPMKLHGEHVVVIGGSSGIGLAAARLARHEGTEVTIAGRSPTCTPLNVK
jgi:NAD(P)-dependent dehydrogenase (short-subunit alcohol dehydrogenase family)